jgi:predicted nucleic acid-binding protein
MARVCVDACFLIGLYDRDDQHHDTAVTHFAALFGEESARHQLVTPWPILYECLGTRYARDPRKSSQFGQHWSYLSESGQLILVDDSPFRDLPLDEHIHIQGGARAFSLVDRVLRAMILGQERIFDFFLTYNAADFVDACQIGDIPLINQESSAESYGI